MSDEPDHAALQSLAQNALAAWSIDAQATLDLLNIAENLTYLITEQSGRKLVLRQHRPGYHSQQAILSELAWLDALRRDGSVEVPTYHLGQDGNAVQFITNTYVPDGRYFVLFDFIQGTAPDETRDMTPGFEELGRIAAHCHAHALQWERPAEFERLTWDEQAVFGPHPTWGNWRDAPGVDAQIRPTLETLEAALIPRLQAFGKTPDRFTLIHADMRLANLLVGPGGTRLIDFDDCGFGWLMYDFAAAISFIEDDPRIPTLKAAWLRGYRSVRALPKEQEAQIDTMIMLRRMALLAWIGSHMEAPEPQALAPGFAVTTARLAQDYLNATR